MIKEKKILVTDTHSCVFIDVKSFKDVQLFNTPITIGFMLRGHGFEGKRIVYHPAPGVKYVQYRYGPPGGQSEYEVEFKLHSKFTGIRLPRWHFECPKCKRDCSKLYITAHNLTFGCFTCSNLTYPSQQLHRNDYYEHVFRPSNLLPKKIDLFYRTRKPEKLNKLAEDIRSLLKKYSIQDQWSSILKKKEMKAKV